VPKLIIIVEFKDESDFDFARQQIEGAGTEAINERLETLREDGHLDGEVDVSWDTED